MIGNDPQEYSYYSLEKEQNPNKLNQVQSFTTTRKVPVVKTPSRSENKSTSTTSKLSITTKVTNLISSTVSARKEDTSELTLTIEERGVMCERLGQLLIDAFRNEKVSTDYLQNFSNEEKKLKYLIEQKETQRNKMQEDSSKSTFLSFIKESVSRFTSEKQVDSRMLSLMKQLKSNYRHLGEKAVRDVNLTLDNVQYDDLPMKINKLERKIITLQKQLDS